MNSLLADLGKRSTLVIGLTLLVILGLVILTLYLTSNNLSDIVIQSELNLKDWENEMKYEFTTITELPFTADETFGMIELYIYGKEWTNRLLYT